MLTSVAVGRLAEAPHYHGHRERLRGRFRQAGADAVSDYELLELVLFRAIPQRDVKPLAKDLIAKFGSFRRSDRGAAGKRLAEIKGIGDAAITELKIVHAAASRLARGQVQKRPVLSSWSSVIDYCRTAMAFADKEQFRVLFLDKRNQLDRRRSAAGRHRRSHAGLSARGRQARARALGDRADPGAQSSVRRPDAVARRHSDDADDHRGRQARSASPCTTTSSSARKATRASRD